MAVARPEWSRRRPWRWLRTEGHRIMMRDVLERVVPLESEGLEVLFHWVPVGQTWESYTLMPPIY